MVTSVKILLINKDFGPQCQNHNKDFCCCYCFINVDSDVLGLSLETNIYGIDIYGEYVKNKYTKLEPGVRSGQQIDGSLFYGSLYADILGNGITYEFKRYDVFRL